MHGEAVGDAVQDIADDAPVGEVTTPMTRGQERQAASWRRIEQAFGGELAAAALFQERHQRAGAAGSSVSMDHLVFGSEPGKVVTLPGRD